METVNYKGTNYKIFTLERPGHHAEHLICVPEEYEHGRTLAILLLCVENGIVTEPYTVLTTNLSHFLQSDATAFVDTNNNGFWGCEDFIKKNGLGTFTGITADSGFCTYPLYRFDISKFTE